jgi:glutamine synthetase
MLGRLVGKRFQAQFFLEAAHKETHGCDYLLANDVDMEPVRGYEASNWERGYGDFVMRPDLSTLRLTPWLPGTALVLCDVVDHDQKPISHSPRAMLKTQIARLAAMGITAHVASELEFYMFDEDYRSLREKHYRGAKTTSYYIEDYHIFQTTKDEGVMRAIRNDLQKAGIPVEASKGEWGPGQQEINLRYADVLTMADCHVIIKNGMKEIAHQQGKAITFMAKWCYDLAGSSCHIHMSLWDESHQKALFPDCNEPLGMSELMKQFLAGQILYACDVTCFLAPYINSYKRLQSSTFAPTKLVWSKDNRTAAFRLCGAHTSTVRIECRVGGADLNPYLAFAGLIAAGIKGIEAKLQLSPPFVGDAYNRPKLQDLPRTLRDATTALEQSQMLRAAFGDKVVDHYVHAAKWEQFEYDRRVTDWELLRGFERC